MKVHGAFGFKGVEASLFDSHALKYPCSSGRDLDCGAGDGLARVGDRQCVCVRLLEHSGGSAKLFYPKTPKPLNSNPLNPEP